MVVMICVEEVNNVYSLYCIYIDIKSALFQFHVHYLLILLMEQSIAYWEMMESLLMKTLVASHVTLVMN